MMEENFRRIADAVRLPEGSRARIRAQIASRAEEQEASMQNKPKKTPATAGGGGNYHRSGADVDGGGCGGRPPIPE